ncbi:uncharacterized protein [Drosophila tropicalis]|uniref:uncharacterized protein n=1 Tax=Drosophila tropicalis TaxID=46794 RepID=UPI0035AB6BD3
MRFVLLSPKLQLLLLTFLCQNVCQGQRIWRKYGPLYESTKSVIAEQSLRASNLWNSTQKVIHQRADQVQQTKNTIDEEQRIINARLEQFFSVQHSPELRSCYKQYERQVASLNRQLIDKYKVCSQSLDTILEHFEEEIVLEASFMSIASGEIEKLTKLCKVWQLKQLSYNHMGVLLCTVSGIGGINQRLATSLELCRDILLEMSPEDLDTPGCRTYQQLKMQFDQIYVDIETCIEEA